MPAHFQYLNSYFDKIFVLSLPRLTDRIEHIKKELEGLHYEFFWGIDKEETSLEELKKGGIYSSIKYQSFYKKKKDMNLGMICGALGHRAIYNEIAKMGYKRTLVLEDDVVPLHSSLLAAEAALQDLPDDWDLVYLGYEKNEVSGVKKWLKKVFYGVFPTHASFNMTRQLYAGYFPEKITSKVSVAGFHDCSHSYGVTLAGAKKILEDPMTGSFHSDNLLSYLIMRKKLKGYLVRPKMINQLTAYTLNPMPSLTQD